MGSVLTDPFTTSCTSFFHPVFPYFCLDFSTSVMAITTRTVRSSPTSAPTRLTRPSSSSSALNSLGSPRPSSRSLDRPDLLLVRSKVMCIMLVPRLSSTPMFSAMSGISLPADLLLRYTFLLSDVKANSLFAETKEWYSRLRFPMPLLAFPLERTV